MLGISPRHYGRRCSHLGTNRTGSASRGSQRHYSRASRKSGVCICRFQTPRRCARRTRQAPGSDVAWWISAPRTGLLAWFTLGWLKNHPSALLCPTGRHLRSRSRVIRGRKNAGSRVTRVPSSRRRPAARRFTARSRVVNGDQAVLDADPAPVLGQRAGPLDSSLMQRSDANSRGISVQGGPL